MAFLYQTQSYLKTLSTKVLSCESVVVKERELFKVILAETIFFAEGGGQPYDQGTINDAKVEFVWKEESQAAIYCDKPLKPGATADCRLDWSRRFDHMQQHSGQHLVSALFDQQGLRTTSWELTPEHVSIDLDCGGVALTEEMKEMVEREANTLIRQGREVTCRSMSLDEANQMAYTILRRSIPKGVVEPVRLIVIDGVDANMCCGTHVESLWHLQSVHLLHHTTTRGKTRVYFIVGGRCEAFFRTMLKRGNQLTAILGTGPEQHCDIVKGVKKAQKQSDGEVKYASRELAAVDARDVKARLQKEAIVTIHRDFSSGLYVNAMASLMKDALASTPNRCVVITCGCKGPGVFIALGTDSVLHKLETTILSRLDGKGSVVKGRLQGKALKIENYKKLFSELQKTKLDDN